VIAQEGVFSTHRMVQDSGLGFIDGVYLALWYYSIVFLADRDGVGVVSRVSPYHLLLFLRTRHCGRLITAEADW
jgi:hypothetical protein